MRYAPDLRNPHSSIVRLRATCIIHGSVGWGVTPAIWTSRVSSFIKKRTVVFQKWRWTAIDVTLGPIFVASLRKKWPMTFIAVRCPHCQSDHIVKRGKTARGTQRYLCQISLCIKGSFLLDYFNRGCLPEVKHTI